MLFSILQRPCPPSELTNTILVYAVRSPLSDSLPHGILKRTRRRCNPDPNPNPATGYNASADRQSWAAMHALFDEVLG